MNPANLPAARSFFSPGDGRAALERIFDAGYITSDAYDELSDEIAWNGSILTAAEAAKYDMNAEDGLMGLSDDQAKIWSAL